MTQRSVSGPSLLVPYRFFDRVLWCNRLLPELQEAVAAAASSMPLRVRFGVPTTVLRPAASDAWRSWPETDDRILQRRQDDAILIRVIGLAEFRVWPASGRVLCRADPGAEIADVRHFLLNQVLPRLVGFGRPLVLHAAGILAECGAIALGGPSGSGKSTLAASFDASGEAALMADDAVHLCDQGAGPRLTGAYVHCRLRPDALTGLGLPVETATPAGRGKLMLGARQRNPESRADRAPLVAVFMLQSEPAASTPVRVRPLSGVESVLALVRQAFFLDAAAPAALSRHVEAAAALVRCGCRVYSLTYPRGFEYLPRVRAAINATVHTAVAPGG